MQVLPSAQYYKRAGFPLKKIAKYAAARGFTDLVVVNEDRKSVNGLLVIHLPGGPTAHFRLSKLVLSKDLKVSLKPAPLEASGWLLFLVKTSQWRTLPAARRRISGCPRWCCPRTRKVSSRDTSFDEQFFRRYKWLQQDVCLLRHGWAAPARRTVSRFSSN